MNIFDLLRPPTKPRLTLSQTRHILTISLESNWRLLLTLTMGNCGVLSFPNPATAFHPKYQFFFSISNDAKNDHVLQKCGSVNPGPKFKKRHKSIPNYVFVHSHEKNSINQNWLEKFVLYFANPLLHLPSTRNLFWLMLVKSWKLWCWFLKLFISLEFDPPYL